MPSLLDPDLVPGYKSNLGPPDDYEAPGATRWTANKYANNRFGVEKGSDGRFRLRSLHRVRALPLLGSGLTVPGIEFDTGESVRFSLKSVEQRTQTIPAMPSARTDVVIDFRADAFLTDDTRYVTIAINGEIVGLVFKFSGLPGGVIASTDKIVISSRTWNQLYGGEGEPAEVTISMVPVDSFTVDTDWITFQFAYTAADSRSRHFVNEEVAFPHRTPGIERRGDGRFQPVAIYKPIEEFGPRVTRGVVWRIIDDPASTRMRFWNPRLPLPAIPSQRPELGPSGRFAFVIPMETQDLKESVFASYGVICGDPA